MLTCKIYISSAPVRQDTASLTELLQKTRRNNARDSVTGLLCVFDSNFLQVLEGDGDQVEATFARIRKDPRHRNIIEMVNEPIGERLFPDWTMALALEEGLSHEDLKTCRDLRDAALAPAGPASHRDVVTTLFRAFRQNLR